MMMMKVVVEIMTKKTKVSILLQTDLYYVHFSCAYSVHHSTHLIVSWRMITEIMTSFHYYSYLYHLGFVFVNVLVVIVVNIVATTFLIYCATLTMVYLIYYYLYCYFANCVLKHHHYCSCCFVDVD